MSHSSNLSTLTPATTVATSPAPDAPVLDDFALLLIDICRARRPELRAALGYGPDEIDADTHHAWAQTVGLAPAATEVA